MSKEAEKLNKESLAAAEVWFEHNRTTLPEEVTTVVGLGLKFFDVLDGKASQLRSLLTSFRRAMGITPKSERCKSGAPIRKKSKARTPEERQQKYLDLADWHKKLAKKNRDAAKNIGKNMKVEDIELSEADQAEVKAELAALERDLQLGGGENPAFSLPAETLIAGREHQIVDTEVIANITPESIPTEATPNGKPFFEVRERFGLSIELERVLIEVEKQSYSLPSGEVILLSGDTSTYGPPDMKVTWDFLSNMTILTAMYAIPFNRFGLLASSEGQDFSGGVISRYFRYVARRFLPIYLEFLPALANAEFISGDDTPGLVVEVVRELARLKDNPNHVPTWEQFKNVQTASETLAHQNAKDIKSLLSTTVAAELGFVSPQRRAPQLPKASFNTTVVSGKAVADDPASTIIFYRSHLGGFANLVEAILMDRKVSNRELVIQSDLATTNLVTNEALQDKFLITQAGCTSHARRPFAQNIDQDPQLLERLVHTFRGLYINERGLEVYGRNKENVTAVRQNQSAPMWEEILEQCLTLKQKWSRDHPIGRGARYVINHYRELTYYLEDPRIPLTNDFSERMVRMENLIEDNALFRKTIEGRCALDIVRSVLQTAVAANLPVQTYVNYVLRAPPELIEQNPKAYLPMNCTHLLDDG